MAAQIAHVVDARVAEWPALAGLAALQKERDEPALVFGSVQASDRCASFGVRAERVGSAAHCTAQALALALHLGASRWPVVHAWCWRSLAAAALLRMVRRETRVSATLLTPPATPAQWTTARKARGLAALVPDADLARALANAGLRPTLAPCPFADARCFRRSAADRARWRSRWGANANAVVVGHLGEPASRLDAHGFASTILTLRLLGVDAVGVTSARAQCAPEAIEIVNHLATAEALVFERTPACWWLDACDAGLWGAHIAPTHSHAQQLHGLNGIGAIRGAGETGGVGALLALELGAAVAMGAALARSATGSTLSSADKPCLAAVADTPIALAHALMRALDARAQRSGAGDGGAAGASAERAHTWRDAHDQLWDSLALEGAR